MLNEYLTELVATALVWHQAQPTATPAKFWSAMPEEHKEHYREMARRFLNSYRQGPVRFEDLLSLPAFRELGDDGEESG